MRNNDYLSLNIFKVKTSSSKFFFNEHDVGCSNFFGRGKHGVAWAVRTPCFVL